MATLSKHTRVRPAMNVTPLVDVVLVLLIIFMVVLPNTDKGAAIEAPTIAHGQDDPEGPEPFALSIDRRGGMFLDTRALDDASLLQVLDEAHGSDPERKLLLRADRSVRYQRVRALFAMAQDVGFPGVMLRVNTRPGAVAAR